MTIEFISYDGDYPNLCRGTLVLKIDGELKEFSNCLETGGSVWFNDDWSEVVTSGPWVFYTEELSSELCLTITDIINENIPHGCCGGCV